MRRHFLIALVFAFAGSASAQGRAIVSADGARFTIPIGRKVTEEWTWNRAATEDNHAEYSWQVRVGNRYSAGFALFKFPGATPQSGSFDELLRAGQSNVASLTPRGGSVVSRYKPLLSGEGDAIVVEIQGKELIDSLFRDHPLAVTFETFSPYSERRLTRVRVDYAIVPSANRPPISAPSVKRLPGNPIIVPAMLPGTDGDNIDGPSLIRVPGWVKGRLGEYYLYFANHAGSYIRLAYANDVAGPWKVYAPGTLHIEGTVCNDAPASFRHIASPDVHVDEASRQIRMYFHCPDYQFGPKASFASYKQVSLVATSKDGLSFKADSEPLGNSYFRVFKWSGQYYALGMPGILYRSADGLTGFKQGPTLFPKEMRHSALAIRNGKLMVMYTKAGDNPERILLSEISLGPDWMKWQATDPVSVLEPERDWEGGNLPHEASERGEVKGPVRQLRDPAIFELNGHTYLLYSVAGESGLAIAEVFWNRD